MRKFLSLVLFLILTHSTAQILNPVQWELSVESVSPNEFDLIFTANIDEHWAIYAQEVEEGGPLPTVFTFEESPNFILVGSVKEDETNKATKHDPVFDMVVSKFYTRSEFRQRVRVSGSAFSLSGNIDYMTCDDTRCTYKPDNPFTFDYTKNQGFVVAEDSAIQAKAISKNANEILYGISPEAIIISTIQCAAQADTIAQ